jgi:glycosyltransferase involved in cell wall biosynthesis
LQNYPADKLRIIEGGIRPSSPDNRLPNTTYEVIRFEFLRLLYTRYGHYYSAYLHLTAKLRRRVIDSVVRDFQPQAILTVAYGYSWVIAAAVAAQQGIPLHFVIHDIWQAADNLPRGIRKRVTGEFESILTSATTRFCVSPYMADFYKQRFNVEAEIIPPSRAADSACFSSPPNSTRPRAVFAFAGSVSNQNYGKALASLADVLDQLGASLLIYSQLSPTQLQRFGLARPNVTVRPVVPSAKLVRLLREEADVLFVPMSFCSEDQENMEIAFPSKLADYTATGLAILVWGPKYSSAVRWAREHEGVAEVVDCYDLEELKSVAGKLVEDPAHRKRIGAAALSLGASLFSHARVTKLFEMAIALPN